MKRTRGFTLLEVIVALVLLGSVLVGSMLAFASHHEQIRRAEKRLEAVRIADRILAELALSPDGIPARSRGAVTEKPNWLWVTEPVAAATLADVPVLVVRFRIFESGVAPRELVSVEVVKAERIQ